MHGKVVETVPEAQVVETLLRHAQDMVDTLTVELGEEAMLYLYRGLSFGWVSRPHRPRYR